MKFNQQLEQLLKTLSQFTDAEGELLKQNVKHSAEKFDPELIKLLLNDPDSKAHFFDEIDTATIFNYFLVVFGLPALKHTIFKGKRHHHLINLFHMFVGNSQTDFIRKLGITKGDENGLIKDNLIIKGNNFWALHTLKSIFAGKVKLIYIAPPYNTGNDSFNYNDYL
jgi:hypothetical protein